MTLFGLHIPVLTWVLAFAIATFLIVGYRLHAGRSKFAFDDLLLDHTTNRASIDKWILMLFAMLSAWVVIDSQLDGKDVTALLAMILGIFVIQRSASGAISAFRRDQPPKEQ